MFLFAISSPRSFQKHCSYNNSECGLAGIIIMQSVHTELAGGHSETVLCAAVTQDGRILSGGEDGQLCVWSLDNATPSKYEVGEAKDDVTSICCSQRRNEDIYVACGTGVFSYDIRNMSTHVYSFTNNEEEINQITLHEKEEYLAACDDSGQIKLYNLPEKKVYKTLRKHTNICSTVCFRPERKWDLLSGGLDSMLLHWDFSRNRAICSIDMQDFCHCEGDLPDSYLVSPPFVYSVDVSRDGLLTACGMENATVSVFDSSKRTLAHKTTLRGHTSGVSQVHFPCFADRLLVSGGNDGRLQIWDVHDLSSPAAATNGMSNGADAANAINTPSSLQPKHSIAHMEKINWLTSLASHNRKAVIVADNSSKLSVYDILG